MVRLITIALALALVNVSCGLIINGKSKSSIHAGTDGAKLSQIPLSAFSSPSKDTGSATDVLNLTLNNSRSGLLIKQEMEGYKSNTYPILKTEKNKARILDVAVPATLGAVAIYGIANESVPSGITVPAFFGGVFGWFGLRASPKLLYAPSYDLPPLEKLPQRKGGESYIQVSNVNAKIEAGDIQTVYYENFNDYVADKPSYTSSAQEGVDAEQLNLDRAYNHMLAKFGYFDTTLAALTTSLKSMDLSCEIRSLKYYHISEAFLVEMNTVWYLKSPFSSDTILIRSIDSKSQWGAYQSQTREQRIEVMLDAWENGLIELLNMADVEDELKGSHFQNFESDIESWPEIELNEKEFAIAVDGAAASVFTVKLKTGHGSACLVSSDGYLVTNFHVIDDIAFDSTATVEIISSTEERYTGRIVRTNPVFDLALLKVDSLQGAPLKIAPELPSLGTDVFAIGTPEDVALGQTVSKGIVSSKRKFDDRFYIQTDVSINGGNSGGALIDQQGNLLGIVNAKLSGEKVEGIGFAIPTKYLHEALKIRQE